MDALIKEKVDYDADVTNKPVEKGEDISDHMKSKPFVVNLSGSIVKDADEKLSLLKKYQDEAEVLTFIGKNTLQKVVITKISTEHPLSNFEGFDYDINLQHVRISSPEMYQIDIKHPSTGEQSKKVSSKVKSVSNEGRKQVQSK